MRWLGLVAMLLATSANAFECPAGKEGPLIPVRWSAKAAPYGTTVSLGIKNSFDKGVRMVEAGVWFVDGLGRNSDDRALQIDPDLKINAGAGVISASDYSGAQRLVGAAFEDFTAHICTEAILFDDGIRLEF